MPPTAGVVALAINPLMPTTLYAGTDVDGVFVITFCPPGCPLHLSEPTPCQADTLNTLEVSGATPGATIIFAAGFDAGRTQIPGCFTAVDLHPPTVVGRDVADTEGRGSLSHIVPAPASGHTILFQAVEPSSCMVSNLVQCTFP